MLKLAGIGHLGNDCRVNQVNGKNVINFSFAHSESYMKDGIKHEKTTWVECNYWPQSDKIAEYLKKGTLVYVEGTPDIRTFEKKDGSTGVSLVCRVFQVQLLGGKKEGASTNGQTQPAAADAPENGGGYRPVSQAEQGGAPAGTNDELPF